ncbi:hypothetical protein ACA910_021979 [Epithemia clementina (nom. ined.)]
MATSAATRTAPKLAPTLPSAPTARYSLMARQIRGKIICDKSGVNGCIQWRSSSSCTSSIRFMGSGNCGVANNMNYGLGRASSIPSSPCQSTIFSSILQRLVPQANTALLGHPTQFAIRCFASKKHKNLLRHAKGFRGRAKSCYRLAIRRVHKSWKLAYVGRKLKRRNWRRLWITRIGAAVRQYSWRYSTFMHVLYRVVNIKLNRKILADLAVREPFALKSVVDTVEFLAPDRIPTRVVIKPHIDPGPNPRYMSDSLGNKINI